MVCAAVLLAQDKLLDYLLEHQKADGTWYASEKGQTSRASQTLLICQALLDVRDDSNRARIDPALEKALAYGLAEVKAKRDKRLIWDHILGVTVYSKAKSIFKIEFDEAIRVSLQKLERSQGRAGAWGYTDAGGGIETSFVTSSGAYALMELKKGGIQVDGQIIGRAVTLIESLRFPDGAFAYYTPIRKGKDGGTARFDKMPGSIARNALCELVLLRAGRGGKANLAAALENFMKHYGELEKNYLQFPNTHDGPYQIAPYYFFFGHYTTALAAVEGLDAGSPTRKKVLEFIRAKLTNLDITRHNKDHYNIGFDTFHAMAFTLMTLRLCNR